MKMKIILSSLQKTGSLSWKCSTMFWLCCVLFIFRTSSVMGYGRQRSAVEIISNPFELIAKTNLSFEIFFHPFGSKISHWNFQNWFKIILFRLFLEQHKKKIFFSPRICHVQRSVWCDASVWDCDSFLLVILDTVVYFCFNIRGHSM